MVALQRAGVGVHRWYDHRLRDRTVVSIGMVRNWKSRPGRRAALAAADAGVAYVVAGSAMARRRDSVRADNSPGMGALRSLDPPVYARTVGLVTTLAFSRAWIGER